MTFSQMKNKLQLINLLSLVHNAFVVCDAKGLEANGVVLTQMAGSLLPAFDVDDSLLMWVNTAAMIWDDMGSVRKCVFGYALIARR